VTLFRRTIACLLAFSVSGTAFVQGVQAAVIGTEQLAVAQAGSTSPAQGRSRLQAALERADVVAALQARGVDPDAARQRVARLTDAEADELAARIDSAPAGGDVLGTIVFIFVLLLVTDILGFTRIFPFTRPIR
jgi:hypothetical protein